LEVFGRRGDAKWQFEPAVTPKWSAKGCKVARSQHGLPSELTNSLNCQNPVNSL